MVLKLMVFDGTSCTQQVIAHREDLLSFLSSLKLPQTVSLVVKNSKQNISTNSKKTAKSQAQFIKECEINIQNQNPNKMLFLSVFVVRDYDTNDVVQLNPHTIETPERVLEGQESRIVYTQPQTQSSPMLNTQLSLADSPVKSITTKYFPASPVQNFGEVSNIKKSQKVAAQIPNNLGFSRKVIKEEVPERRAKTKLKIVEVQYHKSQVKPALRSENSGVGQLARRK